MKSTIGENWPEAEACPRPAVGMVDGQTPWPLLLKDEIIFPSWKTVKLVRV